ncbi:MAG TPA: RsmE family RNA methyltransferase [Acidimicrobiia bacterium]|nr:RsmE family RNA methyltransferase [Acidimicrobiia bacterium]
MSAHPAPGPADADAVAHVFVDALEEQCRLSGDDGHHLQRVRRLVAGERVTAADGSGAWRPYAVGEVAPGYLVLEACGDIEVATEPAPAVSLAVALAKGGLDDIVAAVTELGVARVTPITTARTVVRWDAGRAGRAVRRLRSVARESAMQSRRATVPRVDEVATLDEVAARPGLVVADRNGVGAGELARPPTGRDGWTVLVGPEGGLAPEELATLGNAPRLRLGVHVLRAATAPVAAVAVMVGEASRLLPE